MAQQSFLVVFDFDHTVLECNSDEVIPIGLQRGPFLHALLSTMRTAGDPHCYSNVLQWTNMMSTLLAPFSVQEIHQAAVEYVTYHPDMRPLLAALSALQQEERSEQGSGPRTEVHIASDANMLFIEAIMDHHFPDCKPRSIHSNPVVDVSPDAAGGGVCSAVDQRRLEAVDALRTQFNDPLPPSTHPTKTIVHWYEPEPGHDCAACTANCRPHMCKSRIILRCLEQSKLTDPTIVFIGDGGNDYCPIRQILRPRDFMFARRGFPVTKALEDGEGGACRIMQWSDATELRQLFEAVVFSSQRSTVPTNLLSDGPLWAPLALMHDGHAEEFRTMSLRKRFPALIERMITANQDRLTDEARERLSVLRDTVQQIKGSDSIEATVSTALTMSTWGEQGLPQWLRNYKPDAAQCLAWSHVPWLHGEIFFQQLLLQICEPAHDQLVHVSPYTGTMSISQVPLPASRHDAKQISLQEQPSFLFEERGCGKPLIPGHPYTATLKERNRETSQFAWDPFQNEKRETLHGLYASHVVPLFDALQHARVLFAAEVKEHSSAEAVIRGSTLLRQAVSTFLRAMLWANKVDLSMYSKDQVQQQQQQQQVQQAVNDGQNPLQQLADSFSKLDVDIMNNDVTALTEFILQLCARPHQPHQSDRTWIDIILDNSGVELAADLALSLLLIVVSPSHVGVRLHGKACPFYVSDTTQQDVADLLDVASSQTVHVNGVRFARDIAHHVEATGRIQFVFTDPEWVSPVDFAELSPVLLNKYMYTQQLPQGNPAEAARDAIGATKMRYTAKSALVIFKGDLNFRRLVGDRHYGYCFSRFAIAADRSEAKQKDKTIVQDKEAFHKGHRSWTRVLRSYWPLDVVPVAALRTCKSEISVGIETDSQEEGIVLLRPQSELGTVTHNVQKRTITQLSNGDLGVVLFSGPV